MQFNFPDPQDRAFVEDILKTIAPNWYAEGTILSSEYTEVLVNSGLVTKAELKGYRLTDRGHVFLTGEPGRGFDPSFIKELADKLKAILQSQS